jgi:hypothetical protein
VGHGAVTRAEARTIIEFFDYRCGYCKQVEPDLQALLREDRGICLIFKMLPILGEDSRFAAQVALAAQKPAKYEGFHPAMMAANGPVGKKIILDIAAGTGLDLDQVNAEIAAVEVNDTMDPRGNNRTMSGCASCYLVMVGEGRPSTSSLPATSKDVDADLRRHDGMEATVAPLGALISRRILSSATPPLRKHSETVRYSW